MKTNLKPQPDAMHADREQLKIVIVGHVDHGKSTLVGRLFHDTGSLPDGKMEQIRAQCEKRGMPFEWSFLMDALQAERDQGVTIDTSQIWFKTAKRDYVIIDAPGHKEFLKNMITGAAQSDAALLVIDAKEGVREQSRRHGYLLHLLGVRQIAVIVNKMDAVGYSEDRFRALEKEYRAYLSQIGVTPSYVIPVSAQAGDSITGPSAHMPWYTGPAITAALDLFAPSSAASDLPLRFPIQDVYKFDERRILAGRIESGTLRVGDELLFSPLNVKARVASIEAWGAKTPASEAGEGQSIGITLDDQIFVERGHIASHTEHAPMLTSQFRARVFWLGAKPLEKERRYKLKLGTSEFMGEVKEIEQVIQPDTLAHVKAARVERNTVAEVIFRVRGLVAVDEFTANARTGRFVILQDYDIVGGGIVSMEGFTDQRVAARSAKSKNLSSVEQGVAPEQRALANGHTGGILWFTGLSGSGKSTLALELQKHLFAKGYQVFVLDGDNIRRGLNSDLGFAPNERAENIRRVGEVAALFAQAGVIIITSFISPYREDRHRARTAGTSYFHEIYIKADVATCEKRDVKGLYKKARAGKIAEFTGVTAPYEEPENADLIIDTARRSVHECTDALVRYVERQFVDPVHTMEGSVPDYTGTGI